VSSPVAEAPKIAASATAIVSSGNLLQFKAKGTAWVQVTDAKGVQLISRTLQTGEEVGVAGALPLSVVVGRVDLTSVELRGRPYDLGAIAQNNVARFEVKQ
jgi:cytoskeleton protein RodZ